MQFKLAPNVVAVQSLSQVRLFAAPWTMAHQTLLSFPVSWSFLRFMFIESVMLSNHLILCQPLLFLPSIFPSIRVFPKSWLFASGVQNFGASVSASVLLMNIQVWFPLGLTGLISLLSKGLSRVFTSTTVWKYQFFSSQPFLWANSHIYTCLMGKSHSLDYTDLCWQNDISAF